jgi:hypothetical protein
LTARIAALAVALAVAAPGNAQSADQFDGIYDLRSTSLVSGARRSCSLNLQAKPLHIDGGHATAMFLSRSAAVGEVTVAGVLSLMNPEVTVELTGRIDTQGVLRGYLNMFDGCGYDVDFQKRPTP